MPDGFRETEGEVHENQGGGLDITMNWDDAPVSSARRSIPDDSVWFSRESSADPLQDEAAASHTFTFNVLNKAVRHAMENQEDEAGSREEESSAALQILDAEGRLLMETGIFLQMRSFCGPMNETRRLKKLSG